MSTFTQAVMQMGWLCIYALTKAVNHLTSVIRLSYRSEGLSHCDAGY